MGGKALRMCASTGCDCLQPGLIMKLILLFSSTLFFIRIDFGLLWPLFKLDWRQFHEYASLVDRLNIEKTPRASRQQTSFIGVRGNFGNSPISP
jgi:hypothetical protein